MIGQQPSLFPELDSKHLIKDVDYVDISTLPSSEWRVNPLSDITQALFLYLRQDITILR